MNGLKQMAEGDTAGEEGSLIEEEEEEEEEESRMRREERESASSIKMCWVCEDVEERKD